VVTEGDSDAQTVHAFAALLYALFSIGQLAAQSPTPGILVKAGRLLDPRTGKVLSPAAVSIQEQTIAEVGPLVRVQVDAPRGVNVIDLGNATLLLGPIDSHTHLLSNASVPTETLFIR
jgi:imidazolonepropionase-like amidohydrolase